MINVSKMEKDIKNESITSDCFIIMPISEQDGYEKDHFNKVYDDLFKVACSKSGYKAIRADDVKQTNLIHLDILQKLINSPMAICDLSNRNPNVLFELGLRQAFDKPTVLVQECGTPIIFDISPLRFTEYRKELKYREVLEDQNSISKALSDTKKSSEDGDGVNSIISLLSLSRPASLKDIKENDTTKMLQIIMSEFNELRTDYRQTLQRISNKETINPEFVNRYELDYHRARGDFRKLLDLYEIKAPIDQVIDLHDRLLNRLNDLMYINLPLKIKESINIMITEVEGLKIRNIRNDTK